MELQHHQLERGWVRLAPWHWKGPFFVCCFRRRHKHTNFTQRTLKKISPWQAFQKAPKHPNKKKQKHIICNTYRISPLRMHIFFPGILLSLNLFCIDQPYWALHGNSKTPPPPAAAEPPPHARSDEHRSLPPARPYQSLDRYVRWARHSKASGQGPTTTWGRPVRCLKAHALVPYIQTSHRFSH